MKSFKLVIFAFFVSVSCFCRADVTLRTSSGQEVYLTDSQWHSLQTSLGNMEGMLVDIVYGILGSDVSSINFNIEDLLTKFFFFTTITPNTINLANSNGVYNLSYYSNIYSNQLSRFLSAYTNSLSHQFSALPSQNWLETRWNSLSSQIDALNSPLVNSYFHIYDEQVPNYYFNTSWERMITLTRNQQFQYDYNSNYNPLPFESIYPDHLPLDIQALRQLYREEINILNSYDYQGFERTNPILYSNQLIKVNAILKLYEDKQAVFVNKYKSSLLQADNWKNGYVDFGGDFIPWDYHSGPPQSVSDLISFNPFDMPLNDAFEFATNYLSRLANPNDPVFGELDKETKEVYESEIQKQISTLADVQTQKQLDDFINGLQQMLNTMSNCCQNMSYLPYIADMVSNLVQNVGSDRPEGGTGDGTNDNSDVEFPLGFAPSETNTVSYYQDWQDYNPFIQIVQLQMVNEVKYQLERHNTDEHNERSEQVVSNLTGRIIPIIDKFRDYAQNFSRKSPSRQVHILDCVPIQHFASEHANFDVGLDSNSGFLDTEFLDSNVLSPLHSFFTVIWLLLTALLLISSWVIFVRNFFKFRIFFTKLWEIIKDFFK